MENDTAKKCPKLPWMIDFYSTREGKVPNSQLKAAFAKNALDNSCELNVASKVAPGRLTQIMGTIGPTVQNMDFLKDMMAAGMSTARIKMSHFDQNSCQDLLRLIRQTNDAYSKSIRRVYPLAIAMEIKGPEITTGTLKDPTKKQIVLHKGNSVQLTVDSAYEEHVTENMIYVDYQKVPELIEPGDRVYLDDGNVTLSAVQIVGSIVKCLIEKAGTITSTTKVTVPGVPVDLPVLSDKDIQDIQMAIEQQVDIIIVTNVRNAEVLQLVKQHLGEEGKGIMLMAKIENAHGVENIDEIIKHCSGVMISRSALGIVLLQEKVFLAQKSIIAKCNKAGIPVMINSHQILESMIDNPTPTKPEAFDLVSSVLDGTDCIVLSQRIISGKYPIESIRVVDSLCKEAEAAIHQKRVFSDLTDHLEVPMEALYALAISAVEASLKTNAAVIVVCTTSGRSAKVLSQFRPRCPIIAVTKFAHVARQLNIFRAIYPLLYVKSRKSSWDKDVKERVQLGVTFGKVFGLIRAGDVIIVVTGSRQGSGFTNNMRIYYASEFDTIVNESKRMLPT